MTELTFEIGYRYPQGGIPIFACGITRADKLEGYGVVESPILGRDAVRAIRFGITNGNLVQSLERAQRCLYEYATSHGLVPVYINKVGQECGVVLPGVPPETSVRRYINDCPIPRKKILLLNQLCAEMKALHPDEPVGRVFLAHHIIDGKVKHTTGIDPDATKDVPIDSVCVKKPLAATTSAIGWQAPGDAGELALLRTKNAKDRVKLCSICGGGS